MLARIGPARASVQRSLTWLMPVTKSCLTCRARTLFGDRGQEGDGLHDGQLRQRGDCQRPVPLPRYEPPSEFAVRVPALSMYFLGNRVQNRLMLTPVSVDNRLPLRPGAAVPAENVITAIVPLAQAYNGLPM